MGARGTGSPASLRYAISLGRMLCIEAGTMETPRPAATEGSGSSSSEAPLPDHAISLAPSALLGGGRGRRRRSKRHRDDAPKSTDPERVLAPRARRDAPFGKLTSKRLEVQSGLSLDINPLLRRPGRARRRRAARPPPSDPRLQEIEEKLVR